MKFPIVLIHGFPVDSAIWEPQAKALRAKGYTIITPDLPGFGQSTVPPDATMETLAEAIHEVVQSAGGKAVVGGFSMGGYVTLALMRSHPECVTAAMLINTRADPDSAEARAARRASIEDLKASGPATLFETMLSKLLTKHASAELQGRVRKIMERQGVAGLIAAQQAMAQRRDQTDLLTHLTIPLLVLVGAEDVVTPPSVAMAMHNRVPHSMLVQVAHAGHLSMLEEPERVTGAIETFLATMR